MLRMGRAVVVEVEAGVDVRHLVDADEGEVVDPMLTLVLHKEVQDYQYVLPWFTIAGST